MLDARGGEVLPGLHDHHIHVFAAAAAHGSLDCDVGIGSVADCRDELAQRLRGVAGSGWIRGVAYHEQQLGELDRWALDELCSDRPLRIQHRSGKLWVCNSLGLEMLQLNASDQIVGVERDSQGRLNGRIVRNDSLIAQRLQAAGGRVKPDIRGFSACWRDWVWWVLPTLPRTTISKVKRTLTGWVLRVNCCSERS